MTDVWLEWGERGARELATVCTVIVVVDVLSFSTAVSVAVSHGVGVWPHRWRDESAAERAAALGAVLAGGREGPVSLSPPSLATLPAGTDVLLPSPNGATCCVAAAESGVRVLAACLRNAPAVAAWLADEPGPVGLVAAGEQWPDGSLRPAYEDWVGAGSVAALLTGRALSPEAEAAALAAGSRRPLSSVLSGAELVERGFAEDVATAEDYGADGVVPLLVGGRFGAA
jgi:2-phosphosulfolactate phosphatase